MRAAITALAALAAALAVPVSAADADAASVKFSAVTYDSPGDDTGSDTSLNKEWIRVTNAGTTTQTLTGWTVRDPESHIYVFPAFKLKPGKSVTVHTGPGSNSRTDLFWDAGGYVWNNSGDKAILKDSTKKLVDTCKWGDGPGSATC
jgi:Lamin Tail Domain